MEARICSKLYDESMHNITSTESIASTILDFVQGKVSDAFNRFLYKMYTSHLKVLKQVKRVSTVNLANFTIIIMIV